MKGETQQLFNSNTTQDRHTARKKNKQHTNDLYVIAFKQKKTIKTKQAIKHYKHVTVQHEKLKQYYRKNNDTNDVFVVCTLNIQTTY